MYASAQNRRRQKGIVSVTVEGLYCASIASRAGAAHALWQGQDNGGDLRPCSISTEAIMKVRHKLLVPGLALACIVSISIPGCNRQQDPAAAAPKTTVGTEIDDGVVTARVKSALLAEPDVKAFDIKVETRKGQVQLSGFVDTQARIDSAIALTRKVEGVNGVENGMTLKDGKATVGNTVDDGIVTAKVKSALLADPAVKSFDIAIVTRKGEVQLSGFVDNQAQINRAIDIARGVEGVQSINNEMSIKK
jgi:hyperosmotically inducible periplasmic protein